MKSNKMLAVGLSFCMLGGITFHPANELLADTHLHVKAVDVDLQQATRGGDECITLQVDNSNAVPGGYADVYINPYPHNNLEKLDFTVSWNDTSLTTFGIFPYQAIQAENMPTYSHVVVDYTTPNRNSQVSSTNEQFSLQFDIPLDAVPGTSYDITLSAVDCFQLIGGENIASSIKTPVSVSIVVQEPPISGYCSTNMYKEGDIEQAQWHYDKDTKTLTISGKGKTSFFKSPRFAPWYSFSAEMQKVVIEEGIIGIGGTSFVGYPALTEVSIPDSVIDVDFSPFESTPWLENLKSKSDPVIVNGILLYASDDFCKGHVVIPDGVKSIASLTFMDKKSITSVTIPDSVQYISRRAFMGCDQLREVTFGDHVTVIDEEAFKMCISLEKLILPDSLQSIEYSAFNECKNLKSVVFGSHLKTIGRWAFQDCSSLEEVKISDNIEYINVGAFDGTPLLDNQKGVKYVGAYVVDCDNNATSAVIRQGTKAIADSAFQNDKQLEVVILPESLTSIMEEAFSSREHLKEITIPQNVTKIQSAAFQHCKALERIVIMNPYCRIEGDSGTISNDYDYMTSIGTFNGTIYGYQDSTAQDYAERYGYAFKSLGEAPAYLAGDINADNEITVADVVLLQKWLLAVPDTFLLNRNAADLNEDGILDVYDLALIKRALIQ